MSAQPDRAQILRAIKRAGAEGDTAAVEELAGLLEAGDAAQQARPDSAAQRFSQAAIASGSAFADLIGKAAGVEAVGMRPPNQLMNAATDAGITSPEALRRPDLASVAGRGALFAVGGAVMRPAAMTAEALAYLGSTGGEIAGRELGGEVGAAVGGLTGSLGTAFIKPGARALLTSRQGLADNAELSAGLGTPLGLGESGGSYMARWIDATSARIPGGHHMAKARATRIALQVSDRATRIGRELAGGAISPEAGGRAIRRGWQEFTEQHAQRGGQLYDQLAAVTRDGATVPANYQRVLNTIHGGLSGSTQTAQGLARRTGEFVSTQAQNLAADLAANPRMTMPQLNEIRTRLGVELADPSNAGTERYTIVKRLYGALTEDQRQLARSVDARARASGLPYPGAERAWQRANGFWSSGQGRIDKVNNAVMRAGTDSKLFNAVFTSATTGPETIRAIKRSVPATHWDTALGITLQRMGKETPGASTAVNFAEAPEAAWSLNRFLTNWVKIDQAGATKALLDGAGNATLRNDLTQLARVSAGTRELMKTAANPSGTAQALIGSGGAAGAVVAANFGLLPEALMSLATVGAASAGGQLITSHPRFINWLATSTRIPVAQLPQHIQRLMEVVKKEPGSLELAKGIVQQWDQSQ